MAGQPGAMTLGRQGEDTIGQLLRRGSLQLDLGLAELRIRSSASGLPGPLASVYRHFAPQESGGWADLHVDLGPVRGLRRWLQPQVRFAADGMTPFEPFPADHAFPLMEWGVNWLISRRMNDVLLLHAGVLELDGLALVMPAMPGSGKSTLAAALSLRGWRLLSDEFGAYDPAADGFRAVLKPVALKNRSIEVIRHFDPGVEMGPAFTKTRKGTVSHVAPSADAVARRHALARPGAIVLPRWQAGSRTHWQPVKAQVAFSSLAFNAFNYAVLGEVGFRAVVGLVQRCPAWQLVYSDLDEAIATLHDAWPGIRARSAEHPAARGSEGVRAAAEAEAP